MATFPQPIRLGQACTRWRESDLLAWEQACSGTTASVQIPESAHRTYLRDTEVARRYSVSRCTVWRWSSEAQAAA